MKVSVTSIAAVGSLVLFEDSTYLAGDDSFEPPQLKRMLRMRWPHIEAEFVPLGQLLPLLDLDRMAPFRDGLGLCVGLEDMRVPALLGSLALPPTKSKDEFWHAALHAGFYEILDPEPHHQSLDTSVNRRLIQMLDYGIETSAALVFDETGVATWPRWTGYAEISLGDRGFFRMQLHSLKADSTYAEHVQMLNTFMTELIRWADAWGKRLAPDVDATAFQIHIDKTWVEDRGVADKGCVAFHVDRAVDEALLRRVIRQAEGEDAQLEQFDPVLKRGTWWLCDDVSRFKAGDMINSADLRVGITSL